MALSPPMLRLIEALADKLVDDYLTENNNKNQTLTENRPNRGELLPMGKAA